MPVLEIHPPFPRAGQDEGARNAEEKMEQAKSHSSVTISQTPAILHYLAMVHGLDGIDPTSDVPAELQRAHLNQVTLTILDLSNEVHDTHHPIAAGLYYEDQQQEAKRRAQDVRNQRIPKFFSHFNALVQSHGGHAIIAKDKVTTADVALWHVMSGIEYAFPKRFRTLAADKEYREIFEFYAQLPAKCPNLDEYLRSGKRQPFSEGLFRHYPELDDE